jgi:hypothetical protein
MHARIEGLKYTDISGKLNIQAIQITREVNKILKFFVDYVDEMEDSKDFVNKIEQSSLEERSSN